MNDIYGTVVRLWLTGVLLFLPFNTLIIRYMKVRNYDTRYVRYVDEVTIVLLILFAVWELYKSKKVFDQLIYLIVIPVSIFFIFV